MLGLRFLILKAVSSSLPETQSFHSKYIYGINTPKTPHLYLGPYLRDLRRLQRKNVGQGCCLFSKFGEAVDNAHTDYVATLVIVAC
jgi:hypothetical protein